MTVLHLVRFAVLALATLAVAAGVLLYFNQQRLFYPTPRDYPQAALPGFRLIETETTDGLRLTAMYRPAQPGQRTIMFFHGNGDNLEGAAFAMRGLATEGLGVLLVEYRGYGGNPREPNEAGFYADGEAAMRWLANAGVTPAQTIIIGNSIGSGPATEMAVRHPVAALILVSGFSSLPDVAASHVRWLPVRWMVRDQYRNAAKIGQVEGAILVLHGDHDTLVPVDNARRLRAGNLRSALTIVPGAGHELIYDEIAQRLMADWIRALPPA